MTLWWFLNSSVFVQFFTYFTVLQYKLFINNNKIYSMASSFQAKYVNLFSQKPKPKIHLILFISHISISLTEQGRM